MDQNSDRPQNILARGHSNWLSYCEIDGNCMWRISDSFEDWDMVKNGMNASDMSTMNRDYVKLIKEKKYEEADKV